MSRNSHIFTQISECILTAFLLNLAFIVACRLLYHAYFPMGKVSQVILCAVVTCAGLLVFSTGKYFAMREKTFAENISRILVTIAVMDFFFISLLYFNMSMRLSPYLFVLANLLQLGMLLMLKAAFRRIKLEMAERSRVLVVGTESEDSRILHAVQRVCEKNVMFTVFSEGADEAVLSRVRGANIIYLSDDLTKAQKDCIISYCILKNKTVYLVPETYEIALRKSELTQVGDVPVFNISSFQLTQMQLFRKRTLDIIGSVALLILSCWIWIPAMILIKCEDRGPIFFKQTRSGRRGREFEVIKFRTMIPDAEKSTGAVFAQESDPRITRIGNKLRAMRIDEIPQFINVIKGEMSLVGPRPERPVFVKEFAKTLPEYTSRMIVKPGITGLAQVMGNYTTTAADKVKFDLVYIRNYSFWADVKILLKTVAVVFRKEQAEGVRVPSEKTGAQTGQTHGGAAFSITAPGNTTHGNAAFSITAPGNAPSGNMAFNITAPNDAAFNNMAHGIADFGNAVSGSVASSNTAFGNAAHDGTAPNIAVFGSAAFGIAAPGITIHSSAAFNNTAHGSTTFDSATFGNVVSGIAVHDGTAPNIAVPGSATFDSATFMIKSALAKGLKAAGALACVLVILVGVIVMRYSNLIVHVLEADMPTASAHFEETATLAEKDQTTEPNDAYNLTEREQENLSGSNTIGAGLAAADYETEGGTGGPNAAVRMQIAQRQYEAGSAQQTAQGGLLPASSGSAVEAVEPIHFSDRVNIFYKLISNIATEDIVTMEEMSEDGFTELEKQAVRKIMEKYFTPSEMEYVWQIYRQVS